MTWDKFLQDNPQITVADIVQHTQSAALELISTDDLEPQIDTLYVKGRDPGYSTGWNSVDTHYRIAPRYWTLVTGWPNMGKSSWVDNLAVNTMRKHEWRWLFFSAENQPYEAHWAGLAELYIGKPFNLGASDRMTPALVGVAKEFLREHCWHIVPDDAMTVKRIVEVATRAVDRYGIDCVVIDPWNELDHRRPFHMNETEYVSNALSQLRRFARTTGVHVFVVAHPAKLARNKEGALPVPTPHDVSGSSHFWNKSDYAVCVHRDFADTTGETHVYVQKTRHRWVARLGRVSLFYDSVIGKYTDPYTKATIADYLERRREPGEDDQ
jgi:twinkle protein